VATAIALLLAPPLAPLLAGPVGLVPCAAWLAAALPGALLARRLGWPLAAGACVPIARLLLPVALAHSTWSTLRDGGVRWRGTLYPLAQLRAALLPPPRRSTRRPR
jgi:hypothetical protein